jgi:hypothetical protein
VNRILRFLSATVAVLAVSACGGPAGPGGGDPTTAPAGTSAAATPTAAVTTPATTAPPSTDPWEISTDGIGPYRLGARVDTLPAGLFTSSSPIDSVNCPDLISSGATGMYAGVLLFVVRHMQLVQIESAGGVPGVHTRVNDRVGDRWATVEGRNPTGTWQTRTGATTPRAFVVPNGDRVTMYHVNPIRPDGVGAIVVGMENHSRSTFLSGRHC